MANDPETLRRKTLEYPAALLQLSSEMLATVDAAGRVETLNLVWEYVLGIPLQELRAALFADLFDPRDRGAIRAAMRQLSRKEIVPPLEVRCRHRDGRELWISLRLASLSTYRICLAAGRDITPVRAARQERSDREKLSEIGLVAAVIAHDFNNILAIIRGCSEVMRADLPPAQHQELDCLDGAVRHGSELVHQVCGHSGIKPAPPRDADLNKVVAQMGWMLHRLRPKNVAVDFVLARRLGRFRAEEVHVEQLLLNLAINALDAMPGGGQLVIETANIRRQKERDALQPPIPPGDYVRLSVSDEGDGISQENQARLFEPFFTTKKSGTGLGLYGVKRIVHQCGGHIRLRSRPGEGTTIEVFFPRAA